MVASISSGIRETGPFAEGGMALLSTGETADGRSVVIKRMRPGLDTDPTFRALFESEGRVAECLCHPHIARLIERGEDVCGPFLVFERIDGTDLSIVLEAHLDEKRPLQLVEVFAVFVPLLKALHAAHTASGDDEEALCIIHRDVSPGNVLLGEQGEVKLTDFGVADSSLKSHHTVVGEMKGKFAYMAPEQTRGDVLDPSADVFAAGVMLYECLTGRRLFDAATDADVVTAVREQKISDPAECNPDVTEELASLCLQMLERKECARPSSALAAAEGLAEIAAEMGLEAGWKRAVSQLARAHPRPQYAPLAESPRRQTQRVFSEGFANSSAQTRFGLKTFSIFVLAFIGVFALLYLATLKEPAVNLEGSRGVVDRSQKVGGDEDQRDGQSLALLQERALVDEEPLKKVDESKDALLEKKKTTLPAKTSGRKKIRPTAALLIQKARAAKQTKEAAKMERPTTTPTGVGRLFLASEPWAKVRIDGKSLKKNTPLIGWPLAAGEHVIELENPVYKLRRSVSVAVKDGQDLRKFVDLTR
ncbi:MAG: serine/threonine protein kinase [Deltaproteobacteria bacterium]|nr:serine/threonine protein kinase [Deltaproteobacteria bacterium]